MFGRNFCDTLDTHTIVKFPVGTFRGLWCLSQCESIEVTWEGLIPSEIAGSLWLDRQVSTKSYCSRGSSSWLPEADSSDMQLLVLCNEVQ